MNKKLAGTVLAMMAASFIVSGQAQAHHKQCAGKSCNEKSCCGGKNSCKGKEGCGGKNSCKGKGHSKEAAPAPVKKHNKLKGE